MSAKVKQNNLSNFLVTEEGTYQVTATAPLTKSYNQTVWCSGNALDSYSGNAWFEAEVGNYPS
jgi:hypothetical protein